MKWSRGTLIGLGLALPAVPSAAQPPALLPPAVRGDWTAAAPADPVWFSAKTPVVPAAVPPAIAPNPPSPVRPVKEEVVAGPRPGPYVSVLPDIPAIPIAPPAAASSNIPATEDIPVLATMPARTATQPPLAPPPRPVVPEKPAAPPPAPLPAPMRDPTPPSDAPPKADPPRADAPPAKAPAPAGELPAAPPSLLVPAGYQVPGRHGTFGSTPVHISRDYPTLRELFDFHRRTGEEGGDDPGAAPATDRGFVRVDYLLWWVNRPRIPVLATTSTNGGLGYLGDPGTVSLLGPDRYGNTFRDGFRVRAGWWCDDDGHLGIGGSFFFLGRDSTTTTFDSRSTPTITRPFFAPNDGGFEFGERVARPGFSTGTLVIDQTSGLYGFDAYLRHSLCRTCGFRSEVFAGYRFLRLDEALSVTEYITAVPGNPVDPPGTRIVVNDRFATTNLFNGGMVGYAAELNWGRVSLDARASVALGATHQTIDVSGTQVRQRPGLPADVFTNGGLLAAGPNLGRFSQDRFSAVPEVSLNLGYWVTPKMKVYLGYNALYWSNVVRPGDQVDRTADVTFIPNPVVDPGTNRTPAFSGQNRPTIPFRQSDLWVNGIQFGAEWRW